MRLHFSRSTRWTGVAAAAVLLAACGNASDDTAQSPTRESTAGASPSSQASGAEGSVDTALGQGTWLLALSSAGGADAERATTTYLSYNPSTGATSSRAMPAVNTPNVDVPEAALLVSSDHRWAIPDTGISRSEEGSGRLTVYSTTSKATKIIDIRQRTGDSSLRALGWAFDPEQAGVLRVVDSANRVWSVPVTGSGATRSGSLAKGAWVFADGFNRNSGEPYVESITDEQTNPAGNGSADTSPVSRAGGTVLGSGSAGLDDLPTSPCRLGAAFTESGGTTWMFCADSASIRTYYLAEGSQKWTSFGKPSSAVAPEAAGFWFALPPQ